MVVQFVGRPACYRPSQAYLIYTGLMIFAITVGIYTTIGGFRAVVTDSGYHLQGIMMIIGTAAILLGGIVHCWRKHACIDGEAPSY
ncbi:hypothetical protein P4S72_11325 [Vibrio sp. PP-XX7]